MTLEKELVGRCNFPSPVLRRTESRIEGRGSPSLHFRPQDSDPGQPQHQATVSDLKIDQRESAGPPGPSNVFDAGDYVTPDAKDHRRDPDI